MAIESVTCVVGPSPTREVYVNHPLCATIERRAIAAYLRGRNHVDDDAVAVQGGEGVLQEAVGQRLAVRLEVDDPDGALDGHRGGHLVVERVELGALDVAVLVPFHRRRLLPAQDIWEDDSAWWALDARRRRGSGRRAS